MESKNEMMKRILTLVSILFLVYYHYAIHNKIEKEWVERHFDYDKIKRPKAECVERPQNNNENKCLGMPSGHSESACVGLMLLYWEKYISLEICVLGITIIGLQRIFSNMHTWIQVCAGGLLGLLYAYIYKKYKMWGWLGIVSGGILLSYS